MFGKKVRRMFSWVTAAAVLVVLIYAGRGLFRGAMTISELLVENKELKKAVTNLTAEEQIGYAKVIGQENRDGKLFTTIRFVETARDDKLKKVFEKEYTIEGDVIHFDALVVKFGEQMVMDGKEKGLYMWRRVYGENMSPEEGLAMEEAGKEPARYKDILGLLPENQRKLFWVNIWGLANEPDKLKEYGIRAIYGNVVYSKVRGGLIYVFKISSSGQVYPEIVPDM